MGTTNIATTMSNSNQINQWDLGEGRKPRVLCLHGWRTSGDIMKTQMAAFRSHIDMDYVYLDAPFRATGEPDAGIATFYPNREYFEWYLKDETAAEGKRKSLEYILSVLVKQGPFDGIIGFSQGAGMATRVVHCLNSTSISLKTPLKFVILIGGVPPTELQAEQIPDIMLPSLHIMGTADHLLPHSKQLEQMYDVSNRQCLFHPEGHNIPSVRTNTYPKVVRWVKRFYNSSTVLPTQPMAIPSSPKTTRTRTRTSSMSGTNSTLASSNTSTASSFVSLVSKICLRDL
jgi:predicted esterase